MVTSYDFPFEHWRHTRATNPVESPFAALRLRTDAAKRYKRVHRAMASIRRDECRWSLRASYVG